MKTKEKAMEVKMEIKPRQLEIIEATGKLLTTTGISGLTIKNLATEMNFTESAIYRHFRSKEEIVLTLLQYLHENVIRIITEASDKQSGDFEKDFITLFRKLTLYFKENPYYVVVVFSEGLLDESAQISKRIIRLMNTLTRQVESIILEGQKQKKILSSLTPEQIAQIVIPAFRYQMFRWKFSNFESNIDLNIKLLSHSLMDLLKVRPE